MRKSRLLRRVVGHLTGNKSMAEDIINRLKGKEDEFEAMIADARKRAAAIKDDALKKAKEFKAARFGEIQDAVKAESSAIEDEIAREAGRIEEEAAAKAACIRDIGGEKMDSAVREVLKRVAEGIGDKGDAEDPDNRAERVSG